VPLSSWLASGGAAAAIEVKLMVVVKTGSGCHRAKGSGLSKTSGRWCKWAVSGEKWW